MATLKKRVAAKEVVADEFASGEGHEFRPSLMRGRFAGLLQALRVVIEVNERMNNRQDR